MTFAEFERWARTDPEGLVASLSDHQRSVMRQALAPDVARARRLTLLDGLRRLG